MLSSASFTQSVSLVSGPLRVFDQALVFALYCAVVDWLFDCSTLPFAIKIASASVAVNGMVGVNDHEFDHDGL